MRPYLRLLRFLIPYWFHLLLAIGCMVVLAASTGAMAYLIGPVLKFLFTNQGDDVVKVIPWGQISNLSPDRTQMIIIIPLVIILIAVIKGVSFFGQAYFMGFAGQRVVADLRDRVYQHVLTLPIPFFTRTPTGVLVSRITNDVNLIQSTTTDSFAALMRDGFTVLVLAGVAIHLDWRLSIIALIILPLAFVPLVRFGRKSRRVSTEGQTSMGSMMALLHEAITGIRIVKAFCMEGYEGKRFSDENQRLTRFAMKSIKIKALSPPVMEMLGVIGFAATIWYAAYRITKGNLSPEGFISFFAAILMLYQPIKRLSSVNNAIQQGLAAAVRVFEILDTLGEVKDRSGAKEITRVSERIEFKKVSFSFGERPILKDVDLKVKVGEVIAIVGTSGVGKTTLVNLIPRFYDVREGAILIDGVDTGDITLKSLRSQIGIVSQQVILFNDTVRGNIAYGDRSKTEEETIKAAMAANAHGFIEKLPKGYDTVIGEGGIRLSGGERQRLSIARALLKNPPILILDEATSSLDTESEMEVQKGLNNLIKGRTVFVIAHRLSTIRGADRIIVLADGEIKEMGRHEELLQLGGEYSRLYSMQFQEMR
ncbi:MAG: ATP-binding cassette domain-containing protein [Deltaproteobacteria bacterium]|nr:ATP-binding cassette domain-containing protein [Deltaproteobacteria bacterium]